MCSTSHFPHISKGTALGIVFIQSTENSVVLLRFLEYLLFFCQKLRQYLIYSSLSHTFLSQLQEVTLYPFYICHFTMSKWMAKAEEKMEKKNIVETLLQRCFLFYGLVYFLSSSKIQVVNRALIFFLSGLDTIRPQFQLPCTLPVICLFSNPRMPFQPRLR